MYGDFEAKELTTRLCEVCQIIQIATVSLIGDIWTVFESHHYVTVVQLFFCIFVLYEASFIRRCAKLLVHL